MLDEPRALLFVYSQPNYQSDWDANKSAKECNVHCIARATDNWVQGLTVDASVDFRVR